MNQRYLADNIFILINLSAKNHKTNEELIVTYINLKVALDNENGDGNLKNIKENSEKYIGNSSRQDNIGTSRESLRGAEKSNRETASA